MRLSELSVKARVFIALMATMFVACVFSIAYVLAAQNLFLKNTISINYTTSSTLAEGLIINDKINPDCQTVVFDYYDNSYASVLSLGETIVDVDGLGLGSDGNGNGVGLFYKSDTKTTYILSNKEIIANEDCSNMFKEKTSLKSFTFKNFDTKEVKVMSHMFEKCAGLTSLDISSFNIEAIEDMSSMFQDCVNLSSLTLPSSPTQLKDTSFMFSGCSKLNKLTLNLTTEKVDDMTAMFQGCSSLEDLSFYNIVLS